MKESVGLLTGDTKLSSMSRTIMELQAADCKGCEADDLPVKRPKLEEDHSDIPSVVRVCICNTVWNVLEGNRISPRVWQLLSRGEKKILDYFAHVIRSLILVYSCMYPSGVQLFPICRYASKLWGATRHYNSCLGYRVL